MKHYSIQPRKQRLAGYNRNAHERSRAMSAHLSDELLKEYSRTRSLTVRKGDTVKVVRGAFKGQVAKVLKIFPRKGMISIEDATLTKADNKKVARLFRPSKVILTKLDLSDPWRREKLQQFRVPSREQKREERAEREEKAEKAAEKADREEAAAGEQERAADEEGEAADGEERAVEKKERAADEEGEAADGEERAVEKKERAAGKEGKPADEEEVAVEKKERAAGKEEGTVARKEKAADKEGKAAEKRAEAPDDRKSEHKEAPGHEHPAPQKQSHSKEGSK